MPISKKGKKQLLKVLPTLKEGNIYELGSGFGGLAFSLAKHYPELSVIGYEKSTIPYYMSRLRLFISPRKNLKFYRKDFYSMPLTKASLLVCYLFPKGMERLNNILRGDIFLISYVFQLPNMKSEQIMTVNDLYQSKIYVYKLNVPVCVPVPVPDLDLSP